jgi:hypothetical protein
MSLRVSDKGRRWVISHAFGLRNDYNLKMRLFQNNFQPTQNDTVANYTEATFSGYVPAVLAGWAGPNPSGVQEVVTANNCVFAVSPAPVTGNTVYGYYVTDENDGGAELWADRFTNAPLPMTAAGTSIVVAPTFSEQSQFP